MNYIYIGPNIRTYGLVQYSIYRGEKPQQLIQMLEEKYSLIGMLFVPVSEFVEVEKELLKRESQLGRAFRQLAEVKK